MREIVGHNTDGQPTVVIDDLHDVVHVFGWVRVADVDDLDPTSEFDADLVSAITEASA